MFIGHFAVGFAAKKFAPRSSLAVLLAAPLLADILWPFLLLLGWEQVRIDPGNTRFTPLDFISYPWSHSLLMLCVWPRRSELSIMRSRVTGRPRLPFGSAWSATGCWIVTHRPDMPLVPGGPRYGLGLWNSAPGTIAVESLMLAVGVWMYVRATRAKDQIGRWAFLAYVVLLVVIYFADVLSPPPANVAEIAWAGIAAVVILIPWAWWFDRHRAHG